MNSANDFERPYINVLTGNTVILSDAAINEMTGDHPYRRITPGEATKPPVSLQEDQEAMQVLTNGALDEKMVGDQYHTP